MALYDPAPRETVEAPSLDFTVADVLAWARTKPADSEYIFTDPGNCALCQFLSETGRAVRPRVVPSYWYAEGLKHQEYDWRISDAANGGARRWPYGDFVKRLEALS